ncbi:MAG: hypothetical protein AAGF56_08825, partial [Pseudomonadota bacterium]
MRRWRIFPSSLQGRGQDCATKAPIKWIDLPPVWLAGAAALTWWIAQVQPRVLAIGGPITSLFGTGM